MIHEILQFCKETEVGGLAFFLLAALALVVLGMSIQAISNAFISVFRRK